MADDFAIDFYLRMKQAVTGKISRDAKRREEAKTRSTSKPFEKGRDPVTAITTLDGLLAKFDWGRNLAKADLFANWHQVVGDQTAANSVPEELQGNHLIVRCKSTAWATQLRLMENQILSELNQKFHSLQITDIRFIGPDAPSWKKGKYSVPGRGPRDTYG